MSKLKFKLKLDNTYEVIGAKNEPNIPDIVIPKTHNGKPVTSIGDCAFAFCKNLKSITIPNSIKSIGYSAFYDYSNLKIMEK